MALGARIVAPNWKKIGKPSGDVTFGMIELRLINRPLERSLLWLESHRLRLARAYVVGTKARLFT